MKLFSLDVIYMYIESANAHLIGSKFITIEYAKTFKQ